MPLAASKEGLEVPRQLVSPISVTCGPMPIETRSTSRCICDCLGKAEEGRNLGCEPKDDALEPSLRGKWPRA